MENEKRYCYITYAVPMDEMPFIPHPVRQPQEEVAVPYPDGFVRAWFDAGSFPEDDID